MHETLSRLAPISEMPEPEPEPEDEEQVQEDASLSPPPTEWMCTPPDKFGIYRRYPRKPVRDLDSEEDPDDHTDAPTITPRTLASKVYTNPLRSFARGVYNTIQKTKEWFTPFPSATVARLVTWHNTTSVHKSHSEVNRLVTDVIGMPDFDPVDLKYFDSAAEERKLRQHVLTTDTLLANGWQRQSVEIPLPKERVRLGSEDEAPKMIVGDVLTRRLVPIIKDVCENASAKHFHWVPHELWQLHEDGSEERLYQEVYQSKAFFKEDAKIQAMTRPEGEENVEYAAFPLLAYSDGTRLANFGTASLWPIYIYWGLLSKYVRQKGSSFTAQHIAYIPSVRFSFLRS